MRLDAAPQALEAGCAGRGQGYFSAPCGKDGQVLQKEELKLALEKNFLMILVQKPHQVSRAQPAVQLE